MLDEPSIERMIQNSLFLCEGEEASDNAYSNRYDRQLRDVTTKSAIPEIPFLWQSLTHVKCPAMVLRGENSHILDNDIASQMVSALPNGRLYVFNDIGHSLPRLDPEQFATVVGGFLLDDGVS
jgi:pimeloyl-ACP methyl ester carboxylesterase